LAQNFPDYLKRNVLLSKDDIDNEIKNAFISFDASLREEETVKSMIALKETASKKSVEVDDDPGNEDEKAERKEKEREALYGKLLLL
jgi:dihydroorotase-like cyclic amidohydrolase